MKKMFIGFVIFIVMFTSFVAFGDEVYDEFELNVVRYNLAYDCFIEDNYGGSLFYIGLISDENFFMRYHLLANIKFMVGDFDSTIENVNLYFKRQNDSETSVRLKEYLGTDLLKRYDALSLFTRGDAYFAVAGNEKENLELSISDFNLALDNFRELPGEEINTSLVLYDRGLTFLRIEALKPVRERDPSKAEKDFLEAVDISPYFLNPYLRLFYIAYYSNEFDDADKYLEKIEQISPEAYESIIKELGAVPNQI